MNTLMKSLSSVVATYTLLALASTSALSQTACDLTESLAVLAEPGQIVDYTTDIAIGDCTIQVQVQVDKSSPSVTKVDFKIDRSCSLTGQTQLTGIALEIPGNPPMTTCNIDYDDPANSAEVGEETAISDVPELQQLIVDAADATAMQNPSGNPTADALVAILDGPPATISPSSARPGISIAITDPLGRFQVSDFVVFFEPGKDPAVDGFFAPITGISGDGTLVRSAVPNPIPQGITYSVRVTPDLSTAGRFADLDFFVEFGPTCPPNCGR